MQTKLDQLIGQTFRFLGDEKNYHVKSAKIITGNAVVITDRKPFNFYPSEFDEFLTGIEIVPYYEKTEVKTDYKPSDELVLKSSPMQAEIVVAESNAQKVSNKLMEVFDLLADSPTEETYKKASAMVNVSNSIVAVQMAQIKFLSLKK